MVETHQTADEHRVRGNIDHARLRVDPSEYYAEMMAPGRDGETGSEQGRVGQCSGRQQAADTALRSDVVMCSTLTQMNHHHISLQSHAMHRISELCSGLQLVQPPRTERLLHNNFWIN